MKTKIISLFLLAVLLLLPVSAGLAAKAVPKDIKFLLGMYYGNGSAFLVRENRGGLEIVYRSDLEDKDFSKSNIFPLKKIHFDSYSIHEGGPLLSTETTVNFERDTQGNGILCKIGGKRFNRSFFPGEGSKLFQLEKNPGYQALKDTSEKAVMPQKLQKGKAARLVPLKKIIPDVRFSLRYAGTDNIFGLPLYDASEAFADEETALALKKVSDRLMAQGYGLLVWEGYRPWYVSKLASDLLPKGKKQMLPLPDKGEDRNTGRTVDVGLYSIADGSRIVMISDFDEVSVRQFPGYTGGTEEQRRQRDLLVEAMKKEGFIQGKEEWWHFSHGSTDGWRHLNTPYGQIK